MKATLDKLTPLKGSDTMTISMTAPKSMYMELAQYMFQEMELNRSTKPVETTEALDPDSTLRRAEYAVIEASNELGRVRAWYDTYMDAKIVDGDENPKFPSMNVMDAAEQAEAAFGNAEADHED